MAKGRKIKQITSSPGFVGSQVSLASAPSPLTSTRRNRAATQERADKWINIKDAVLPFHITNNYVDIQEALLLCRKAYYSFPLLRNTIDIMTELSNSAIYLQGGNKAVRSFIGAWLDRINIWSLKEKFFREFFRSGNVFMYRFDGKFTQEDVVKLTQVYGASLSRIPIRYIMLNPEDLRLGNNSVFSQPQFYKVLNSYELDRIRNPKTPEDKEIFNQLDPTSKRLIKNGGAPYFLLDPNRLYAVFYKKQDYEPFAIPMAYPILDDINWKLELKKVDQSVARTVDWAILLMTMGTDPDKGGINPNNMNVLKQCFENESVKKVLVADYTTKGEWLIPDISKILGPEKYQIVNEDIKLGLNIILVGDEKFANSLIKTQVFLERLKEARNAFLNEFLIPEIKKLCQDMNFKNYPVPCFEEIDLKDELQFARIYTRLMELGVLTPQEGIDAMETGKLPLPADSLIHQTEYRDQRGEGLYNPLVGGQPPQSITPLPMGAPAPTPTKTTPKTAGRPAGTTGIPQSTKNIKPMGSKGEVKFSLEKLKENLVKVDKLSEIINKQLCKKFKLKKLNEAQENVSRSLLNSLIVNEPENKWEEKVKEYIEKPKQMDETIAKEIDDLGSTFQTPEHLSILLYKSKIN